MLIVIPVFLPTQSPDALRSSSLWMTNTSEQSRAILMFELSRSVQATIPTSSQEKGLACDVSGIGVCSWDAMGMIFDTAQKPSPVWISKNPSSIMQLPSRPGYAHDTTSCRGSRERQAGSLLTRLRRGYASMGTGTHAPEKIGDSRTTKCSESVFTGRRSNWLEHQEVQRGERDQTTCCLKSLSRGAL